MPIQYEEYEAPNGELRIKAEYGDGTIAIIPADPANSDYQRYLRWLNGEDEDGTLS